MIHTHGIRQHTKVVKTGNDSCTVKHSATSVNVTNLITDIPMRSTLTIDCFVLYAISALFQPCHRGNKTTLLNDHNF